jgi:quercetin dioxygenase-like cupin family protein
MTTILKTATTTHEHFLRRGLPGLRATAAAALVLGLMASGSARAQDVSPLQIIALATGFSPQKTPNMQVKGGTDVLQSRLVFQPGAETGWHIHPGPVVVVVKSGAITETHANGCVTVHPAGSVFFETEGEIHNAANQTGMVAEVYATFISPTGSQPLIPVSNPGRACSPGNDRQEEKK